MLKHLQKSKKGFTLLETLASITILSLIIIGPLTVIVNSSSYAKNTKDTMIASYLAEEAVELLQNQYDSLYVFCKKQPTDPLCTPASTAENTAGKIAWRIFKERMGAFGGQPSCFLKTDAGTPENPLGCSFDFIHMIGDITLTPVRYLGTSQECSQLVGVNKDLGAGNVRHTYVCRGIPAHILGPTDNKIFSRTIFVEQMPTFEAGARLTQYNDDLRISVRIQFSGVNGFTQVSTTTRFMHSQP